MKKFKFSKKELAMTPEQIQRKLDHIAMSLTDSMLEVTAKNVAAYANMRSTKDANAVIKQAKTLIRYYSQMIDNVNEVKDWLKIIERIERANKK